MANCSVVKPSLKGLFILTMMAIFSRRTSTCFKPCAFSAEVSLRPRDATSTLPSKTAFTASSLPLIAISTLVPANWVSKFSLRLWLTITELGEPSTLTTVPFSTFSGRGKSGVSLLDSAWMGKETNKFATIGLVVMAINKASLIITLSFCCCCHIYP